MQAFLYTLSEGALHEGAAGLVVPDTRGRTFELTLTRPEIKWPIVGPFGASP